MAVCFVSPGCFNDVGFLHGLSKGRRDKQCGIIGYLIVADNTRIPSTLRPTVMSHMTTKAAKHCVIRGLLVERLCRV